MKSNKIYKIEFLKVIDFDDEIANLFFEEISRCLDKGEEKYIGFSENEDIFLRLTDYKIQMITNVLKNWNLDFKIFEVTKEVIKGEIQKLYPEVEELTPHLFENFRIENTSVNDVLDKIIESGIDSIDDIDKKILAA
jgi:hypothetical protein